MHHISALLWFFFAPPVKTSCITNAIWLAGAIVWKKVGPFRWVSRKAFKLSPRSLLPSYRNLLGGPLRWFGQWSVNIVTLFWFSPPSYSAVLCLIGCQGLFRDVCLGVCMWHCGARRGKHKGFEAYRQTIPGVQVYFACRQTAMIQDGTCLTDVFTAAALRLLQLSDSPSPGWHENPVSTRGRIKD